MSSSSLFFEALGPWLTMLSRYNTAVTSRLYHTMYTNTAIQRGQYKQYALSLSLAV
ncbi:predicted protein [Plenodomus lingam JN3]|uniref:Predicted protein n=1 Tax=Leptosphaeria maculans (strain JN3 / isolate v23.1.3 / race Av1-4-5-6-7-8) TaxID=985895 RepID=E4ZLP6_LEPMJ|nr:predicted protein [Plenodomus lingam JN3]CBX92726.1 predicted protein [Plenodomus lingam JN3]